MNGKESYNQLFSHCSQYGEVNAAFYFQGSNREQLILIEYDGIDAADEVIRTHRDLKSENVQWSRYPIFNEKLEKFASNRSVIDTIPLNTKYSMKSLSKTELYQSLLKKSTVDEQIQTLFHYVSMSDLAIRHRYLALVQIEDSVRGMYPNVRAYPFGSSASGFGKKNSDLDMLLTNHDFTISSMAGIMDFLPGIQNMLSLPNATTPIIKYYQGFLNLDVDLSLDNM